MRSRHSSGARATKDTAFVTYNLVQVPRELLETAKAKARAELPAVSLRHVLVRFLVEYVGRDPMSAPALPRGQRPTTIHPMQTLPDSEKELF